VQASVDTDTYDYPFADGNVDPGAFSSAHGGSDAAAR
jgi:hypothetical protein